MAGDPLFRSPLPSHPIPSFCFVSSPPNPNPISWKNDFSVFFFSSESRLIEYTERECVTFVGVRNSLTSEIHLDFWILISFSRAPWFCRSWKEPVIELPFPPHCEQSSSDNLCREQPREFNMRVPSIGHALHSKLNREFPL